MKKKQMKKTKNYGKKETQRNRKEIQEKLLFCVQDKSVELLYSEVKK